MPVARVMLAWELGGNDGHLVVLRALAAALRRAGHECVFAVRLLGSAHEFLDPALGPLVQAPLRTQPARRRVRIQLSYASLLHNTGFGAPLELAGRIRAWHALFRAFRTEYVFADHSPVALVAARTQGLPAACLGNGFTLPPRLAPFPSARPGVPQSVLLGNEAAVLGTLNQALARLGRKPFALLQDIFRAATPALLTYPALDPYQALRSEPSRGVPDYCYGHPPRWPAGRGPKVFAYLRPSPSLPAVLEGLRRSRARVLLRVPGARREEVAPFLRPGLSLAEGPVHFGRAATDCDAFLNYGAHATVAEFLLAGKPGLLVPDLQERALTARRAAELGAAVTLRAPAPAALKRALDQVLEDPTPRRAAEAFAHAHEGQDRAGILPALVQQVL